MSQRIPVPPDTLPLPPVHGGRLVAADGRDLPLRDATLRAEARGGLARVVVRHRFRNAHPEPCHVTYQLPLPVDGAVTGFTFRIGPRTVTGEVDRRAAARERFEEAILEGRTAALLEQERTSLFTQELGNIPPETEVLAEVTLDQRLRWLEGEGWEWRFPTVIGPRYLGAEGRVPDAPRVTVDVAGGSLPPRLTPTLVIRDPLAPGGTPASPSHAIRVAPRDDGLEVGAADPAGVPLDRDLVVRWPVATPAVGLALETGRPPAGRPHGDAAYGLLTLVPPAAGGAACPFSRDLVVLLDASGSMTGAPLAQARAVVGALVESLGESDRLELIAFAERPRRWQPRPVAATAAAREAALRWLHGLQAGGGTEMGGAIEEALRPLRPDAQRQVVLVTDGLVGFEAEIVATVARALPPGSRLHTVGVGPAVNRTLTAPAARAGRGTEVVTGLDEPADEVARRLVARTRAPLLTDLQLDGPALLAHAPARLPDLLAGGPALVGVALRPEGGRLRVRGRAPAGEWEADIEVPAIEAGRGSPAVVALYGREAVEDLECRRAAGEAGADAEIERLGLAFQIATRLTAWVAVSEEPAVDPTRPARRERLPQSLPAGLSAEGLGLRSAEPSRIRYLRVPRGRLAASTVWPEALLSPDLSDAAIVRELEAVLAGLEPASEPADGPPVVLAGRLVRRRGRELVVEILLDRAVDWAPARTEVVWPDGGRRPGTVDAKRTTGHGRIAAGLLVRLALALDADGPSGAPAEVRVTGGAAPLTVTLGQT